jgi:6-phosphogluconolactonase
MGDGALEVSIFQGPQELANAAAELVVAHAREAISLRDRFDWVLAGGQTPRALYALLASHAFRGRVDWQRVHFYWGDERCVPPDHHGSNYRMVKEALLDVIQAPAENVHRMLGEEEPTQAAARYEELLHTVRSTSEHTPRFDLILLGMGTDGHTASLFPGTAALRETTRWVVPTYVEKLAAWRLTLTTRVINAAAQVLFMAQGADKAARLALVLGNRPHDDNDGSQQETLPVRLVQPRDGDVRWLLDADAAALLDDEQEEMMPS